jgi:hypothetical protein
MTNSTTKPTTIFWVISIIALFWNIMGVVAYLGQAYMTDEALALMPEAEQAYYANLPAWVTAAFAIAVFSGFLGCVALVLKKKWAKPMFVVSFITVVAQIAYNLFIQEYVALSGSRVILPLVTLLVAGFLVWFAKDSIAKRILN